MCRAQAKASDFPIYNIFVPQKVPLSKISDDVIACGLGAPIKNPGYAYGRHARIVEKGSNFLPTPERNIFSSRTTLQLRHCRKTRPDLQLCATM